MNRWMPALAVVLAGSVGMSPAYAQAKLRYKFQKGETIEYVLDQKQKVKTSVGGQDMQSENHQIMEMTWKVESVADDGSAKIKFLFGRTKMIIELQTGK